MLALSASGPLIAPLLWWIDAMVQPESNILVYIAGLFLSVTAMVRAVFALFSDKKRISCQDRLGPNATKTQNPLVFWL